MTSGPLTSDPHGWRLLRQGRAFAVAALAFLPVALAACASTDQGSTAPILRVAPPRAAPDELVGEVAEVLGANVVASGAGCPEPGEASGAVVFEVLITDSGVSGAYRFDPSELNFKVGDTVKFTFTTETELHTFTAESLDIDCSASRGEPVTFSFTFDSPGTFPLICIPHESQGMKGTITVN